MVEQFRHAMRYLASGVAVITSSDAAGKRFGMAATSVTSLSMDPPSLLVCINKSSSILATLLESRRFTVNMLAESQRDILECFGGSRLADKRFSFGDWRDCEGGAPYLSDALAWVDCRLDDRWTYGTHLIIVGRALMAGPNEDAGRPLVYYDGAPMTFG
ncbi:MAG: flavin reductase family protein [Candidatus Sphingomonas colombiensis]|nr:flavin reductase family protein [Sphingomonas sp.]WEK42229.1 MAG: flavin reductase family protein [Sphingomonas sp.]